MRAFSKAIVLSGKLLVSIAECRIVTFAACRSGSCVRAGEYEEYKRSTKSTNIAQEPSAVV